MRKARAATTAAASKPKPKPKPKARSRATPKAKPSPASLLSGASSPSSAGGTASPAADVLSFLTPSRSPEKTRTRCSPLASPAASPLAAPAPAALSTIADLRSLAASHLDSLKRRLDALHGDSVRDLDASHSRLSKRVKMQTHGCLQLAEEADKEHKKVADKITERTEVVKTSYKKFMAQVQASTSRGTLETVTVAEMAKSAERAIDGLRSRYNISATIA